MEQAQLITTQTVLAFRRLIQENGLGRLEGSGLVLTDLQRAWKDRAEGRFSKIPPPKSDYEKKSLRAEDDVSHRAPTWLAMYGIL